MLTETAMTPAQREQIEDLLSGGQQQIVRGIAADRKIAEDQVAALIDKGPFIADEALQAHLVDRIGYRDEAVARARERAGGKAELVSLKRYLDAAGRPHDSGPRIALIYATGLITTGDSGTSALSADEEITARKLSRAFRQAAADKEVRAILFRIDSPGGSAVASETVWREVERAHDAGKPVVASMGDVAGSGGYYIAAPADKIVAEPGTLTGSIGVLAGKIVIADLLHKLGISSEKVERGANSGMFSEFEDFSALGRERLEAFLDSTYRGFKARVAAGRHLSADQVEAAAKGRVWSGEAAKAKGLIDELGGYAVALRLAKEAAKIGADEEVKLVVYPREKNTIERLYTRLTDPDGDGDNSSSNAVHGRLAELMRELGHAVTLLDERPALRMPPLGEIR